MRLAIIDIGYNAIRAVVYENETVGAVEIFNDKFKSNVLSLLDMKDIGDKHQIYVSLEHLMHIFKILSVGKIKCVATAVLRGHKRTDEFKSIIKERFGIEIDVISGKHEAYLAAAGLICGTHNADGIVADLGGGSLELAAVGSQEVGHLVSLPFGTKVINSNSIKPLEHLVDTIKTEFNSLTYENIYLTGGAFRMIAKFYIEFTRYPLKSLHNLEISAKNFELFLEKIEHINDMQPFYYEKKIEANAIVVAKAILKAFIPKRVTVSNYGLKEGVRFVSLPKPEQAKNVVYERVKALVGFYDNFCDFIAYHNSAKDLLIAPDSSTDEIINLAIMLSYFNKNIDRTLRANFVVEFMLSSDIPFSHRTRVMLALILSIVSTFKTDLYIHKIAKQMLGARDYSNSHIIGNFIKIAKDVDGPEFIRPSFVFTLQGKYIAISAQKILPRFIFKKIYESIKAIAIARK